MAEQYKPMTSDAFFEEVKKLDSLLRDFCNVKGNYKYEEVCSNTESIEQVILRVDKRRHYYLVFHKDMKTSEYKETALYCFWILKLRPFWIGNDIDDAHLINELFCVHLFLSLVKKYNTHFNNDRISARYIRELCYSFRYRDLSKEAIIQMLEPYFYEYMLRSADEVF